MHRWLSPCLGLPGPEVLPSWLFRQRFLPVSAVLSPRPDMAWSCLSCSIFAFSEPKDKDPSTSAAAVSLASFRGYPILRSCDSVRFLILRLAVAGASLPGFRLGLASIRFAALCSRILARISVSRRLGLSSESSRMRVAAYAGSITPCFASRIAMRKARSFLGSELYRRMDMKNPNPVLPESGLCSDRCERVRETAVELRLSHRCSHGRILPPFAHKVKSALPILPACAAILQEVEAWAWIEPKYVVQ